MNSGTALNQRLRYEALNRAMFDYIECACDEYFDGVQADNRVEAIGSFVNEAHGNVHASFAMAVAKIVNAIGRDH